jgi:hypothetical protein
MKKKTICEVCGEPITAYPNAKTHPGLCRKIRQSKKLKENWIRYYKEHGEELLKRRKAKREGRI